MSELTDSEEMKRASRTTFERAAELAEAMANKMEDEESTLALRWHTDGPTALRMLAASFKTAADRED